MYGIVWWAFSVYGVQPGIFQFIYWKTFIVFCDSELNNFVYVQFFSDTLKEVFKLNCFSSFFNQVFLLFRSETTFYLFERACLLKNVNKICELLCIMVFDCKSQYIQIEFLQIRHNLMIIRGAFDVRGGPKVGKLSRLRWLFLTLWIIQVENDWKFYINIQICFSLNCICCNLTSLNFRVISLSKGPFSSLLSFAWIPTLETSFALKWCSN